MPLGWLDIAQYVTTTASNLSTLGFGAAKASTKLGFAIARGIASVTPIPFLTTSLNHLEHVSLLPILLGETITSTSLVAASSGISYLLQHNGTEASFSLTSFVELVRREWAEFGVTGRSVIEVSRAVAAWAAIQGFTKQWSEERWLKAVVELTPQDLKPPPRPHEDPVITPGRIRRAISKVSVTEDIIAPGRQSQVISADIGERTTSGRDFSPTSGGGGDYDNSHQKRLSNYETWKTMQRLSKIVLAGYGGPTLLFFGVSLYPDAKDAHLRKSEREQTEREAKDAEEGVLVHAVKDAEADALPPPTWSDSLPRDHIQEPSEISQPRSQDRTFINQTDRQSGSAKAAYSYSWWNVLLGKHDRDIFEGFAFAEGDESEADATRSAYNTPSVSSSPAQSYFGPSRSNSFKDGFAGNALQFPTAEKQTENKFTSEPSEPLKTLTAVVGDMSHMPRFWVLTDHGRRQVIVVVRGTMSFNEIAADLACDPASFTPATMSTAAASEPAQNLCEPPTVFEEAESQNNPLDRKRSWSSYLQDKSFAGGRTTSDLKALMTEPTWKKQSKTPIFTPDWSDIERTATPEGRKSANGADAVIVKDREGPPYEVHGGMLCLARAMGSKGKPVYEAVLAALSKNRRYELILCGHSLGAGLATLFALMWADPVTCRTVPSSGLPPNRRVSVYTFAPPCVTSAPLSLLCKNMVTSFVYSYDAISRLSLGSMRDMNRAAYWLCEGKGDASTISLLRRALQGKFLGSRSDTEEEKKWFIAVRKTLEANMHYADMFPPGRIWWVLRNESLHPSHQIEGGKEGLRLFEVTKVEDVFRQIEFKGDMLSSHMPSQYIRIISELQP